MDVKERIKKKATELYCKYGTKSVTMDEIAEQAGVSKKTIYQCFSDKNELVDDVLLLILEMNREACNITLEKAENAIEEVFLLSDAIKHFIENLNPSFIVDIKKGHPGSFKKFQNYRNGFIYDIIYNNIEKGKQEGLYRTEMNSDVITKMRLETIILPFDTQVFPSQLYSAADLQNELVIYYLYGMATLKGHQCIQNLLKERENQ